MHKLLEKLDKELHKYADREGDLKPEEWKCVYEAIRARKDLLTSMAMTGEDSEGNYTDGWMDRSSNGPMRPNYNTRSYDPYSRGGRSRDSMGRYSGNYSGTYPAMDSYSGHGDDEGMMDMLYQMLGEAQSEAERSAIQRKIKSMERR